MWKKAKVIAGMCLMGQSLLLFVLFLIYWNKSRSLSKTLAVFSAVEGASGALLVLSELHDQKISKAVNEEFEILDEEFDDDINDSNDINCSFD